MTEIKWEDPPTDGRQPGKYERLADELRARPGQWAVFSESCAGSQVANIRRGALRGMPAGEFDAVSKTIPGTGKSKVWVRYVGGAA